MSKATFVEQGVPPALPAAGRVTLYALNGFLYSIDDVGTITPLTGGSNEPEGYVNGLDVNYTTSSTLTIGVGTARSSDDLHDMDLGAPALVDITNVGVANGLDSGGENANAWYAVHLIDDSNNVNPTAGLLSLSPTSPSLPVGYDKFRLLMWARNHVGDFFEWQSLGVGRARTVFYDVDRNASPQRITSGGAATTWSTVDGSTILPPQGANVLFNVQQLSGSVGTQIRPNAFNDPGGIVYCRPANSMQIFMPITDQMIEYQNLGGGGSVTIDVVAWTLSI